MPSAAGAEPQRDPQAVETLVAAGRHDEALQACTLTYARPLARMCFALVGSASEAEELAQEALIAAYAGFAGYRGQGSVRGWLFGIARHLCARHLATRTRRAAKLHLLGDPEPAPIDESVAQAQAAQRTRDAIAGLPEDQREAVVLRYEAGLSYRDVALACGCDEATARKRVSRALVRLRDTLGER